MRITDVITTKSRLPQFWITMEILKMRFRSNPILNWNYSDKWYIDPK